MKATKLKRRNPSYLRSVVSEDEESKHVWTAFSLPSMCRSLLATPGSSTTKTKSSPCWDVDRRIAAPCGGASTHPVAGEPRTERPLQGKQRIERLGSTPGRLNALIASHARMVQFAPG